MKNSKELTIYTKMNIYYCAGFEKPELIAHSLKDLFNNKNARYYLPSDKEELNELKDDIYYFVHDNNIVDIDFKLGMEHNIFICKNSMLSQLVKVWGFTEPEAKKHFTNYVQENENNKRAWQSIVEFYQNW